MKDTGPSGRVRLCVDSTRREGNPLDDQSSTETDTREETPAVLAEHHRQLERLREGSNESYVGDAVLGAMDGAVTTFAIVSGAVGGQLSAGVIILLGFANLVADGFSMAVSNYEGTKSERERLENARETIHRHIQTIPRHARQQVRDIYREKGFEGEALEDAVDTICEEVSRWEETLIRERWGMRLEPPDAVMAGGVTFGAFVAAGLVPLLPFLFPTLIAGHAFAVSAFITSLTFAGVGLLKGRVLERSLWFSGLGTLFSGGGAAVLAYGIGALLRGMVM